jgi:hypothetical protein
MIRFTSAGFAQCAESARPFQKHHPDSDRVSELRHKSQGEWECLETQARDKLAEIAKERQRQMETKLAEISKVDEVRAVAKERWMNQEKIIWDSECMQTELAEAIEQEREYEKCSYRRTACKALENLIKKYNSIRTFLKETNRIGNFGIGDFQLGNFGKDYVETGTCKRWVFDHYGEIAGTHKLLVDPGRFWSYDLQRSRIYGERPL